MISWNSHGPEMGRRRTGTPAPQRPVGERLRGRWPRRQGRRPGRKARQPHRATTKRGKPAPPGEQPEAAPWRAAQVHEQVSARAEPRRQGCGLSLARAAAVALGPKSGDYRAAVFQQDLAQLLLVDVTVTRRGVRMQHEMTRRGPRPGRFYG